MFGGNMKGMGKHYGVSPTTLKNHLIKLGIKIEKDQPYCPKCGKPNNANNHRVRRSVCNSLPYDWRDYINKQNNLTDLSLEWEIHESSLHKFLTDQGVVHKLGKKTTKSFKKEKGTVICEVCTILLTDGEKYPSTKRVGSRCAQCAGVYKVQTLVSTEGTRDYYRQLGRSL
jgi:hypothetical protein